MEELIARIVANVGINEGLAKTAVGIILNMFKNNGDSGLVGQLMSALPGSGDLADAAAGQSSGGGGGLGGIMGAAASMLGGGGGGVMDMVGQLTGAGLSIDQSKGVGSELIGFAKEKAGEDTVSQLIGSIPGLDKIM